MPTQAYAGFRRGRDTWRFKHRAVRPRAVAESGTADDSTDLAQHGFLHRLELRERDDRKENEKDKD